MYMYICNVIIKIGCAVYANNVMCDVCAQYNEITYFEIEVDSCLWHKYILI